MFYMYRSATGRAMLGLWSHASCTWVLSKLDKIIAVIISLKDFLCSESRIQDEWELVLHHATFAPIIQFVQFEKKKDLIEL